MIRMNLTSVLVDDQTKALAFYTEKLGFIKKTDVPGGRPFKQALVDDGIPFTRFAVDDVHAEAEQLKGLGRRVHPGRERHATR